MPHIRALAATVALCLGGVLLPGSAAAAGAGVGTVVVPASVAVAGSVPEACASGLLPLDAAADDLDAPREPLPAGREAAPDDLLAAPGLQLAAGAPAPPAVPATAWLVADLDSGGVLASCNARTPLAPASTLKLLTALALLPGLDPATVHTAGTATAQVGGSRVGVVEGAQYTVDDLAHGLMLGSGNDAAVALGELVGGQDVALERMNSLAATLGASDTVARTTSGLDAPGQASTAHDLAVIARAALAEPRVAQPASTRGYVFPGVGRVGEAGRETYEIQTTSRLLRNYPGATGLKSGYTRAAGGSYVGTAERDGRRYVVTLLRAQGRPWHHARELLDWAWVAGARAEGGVATLASGPGAGPGGSGPSPTEPSTGTMQPDRGAGVSRLRDDESDGGAEPAATPSAASPAPVGSPEETPAENSSGTLVDTTQAERASSGASDAMTWLVLAAVLAAAGGVLALRRRGPPDGPAHRV